MNRIYQSLRSTLVIQRTEENAIKLWLNKRFPGGGVVIGGCGRSGTTLLLGLLSAHSQICAISEETWALYPSVQPLKLFKALYKRQQQKPKSTCWCEKTPRNILNGTEILDFLGPQGKFIHIVRDGRDVVTSRHPSRPGAYWVPIERWVSDVTAGLTAEDSPQMIRVYYEDLVSQPEQTIKTILNFIGLKFEEVVLQWEIAGTVQAHKAWAEGARAINTNSIGKWKSPEYQDRVSEFMNTKSAVALLARLNYTLV